MRSFPQAVVRSFNCELWSGKQISERQVDVWWKAYEVVPKRHLQWSYALLL